jgi:hypothetical protein
MKESYHIGVQGDNHYYCDGIAVATTTITEETGSATMLLREQHNDDEYKLTKILLNQRRQ